MVKRDYQREMEAEIAALGGRRASLMMHACCAPCSSAVLERVEPYFETALYYYNPNIQPVEEYEKRLCEFTKLLKASYMEKSVNLLCGDYDEDIFLSASSGLESEPEGGARCTMCFEMRLRGTAIEAQKRGFEYFSTTLTVSPHKNAAVINHIGEKLAAQYGVKWLPADFKKRDGYLRSIQLSKEYNLYRQCYCGCLFSAL